MYERLNRLYKDGRIDLNGLIKSVEKKLISEEQFFYISGINYEVATGNKAGEGRNAPKKESVDNG